VVPANPDHIDRLGFAELWIPTCTLARPAGHPFYQRLNQLLAEYDFDRFVEDRCGRFYAVVMGRPGLARDRGRNAI
jgi:hypothetical protein